MFSLPAVHWPVASEVGADAIIITFESHSELFHVNYKSLKRYFGYDESLTFISPFIKIFKHIKGVKTKIKKLKLCFFLSI